MDIPMGIPPWPFPQLRIIDLAYLYMWPFNLYVNVYSRTLQTIYPNISPPPPPKKNVESKGKWSGSASFSNIQVGLLCPSLWLIVRKSLKKIQHTNQIKTQAANMWMGNVFLSSHWTRLGLCVQCRGNVLLTAPAVRDYSTM